LAKRVLGIDLLCALETFRYPRLNAWMSLLLEACWGKDGVRRAMKPLILQYPDNCPNHGHGLVLGACFL
jgi:hypothetical protein